MLYARTKHFNMLACLCPDDIRVFSDSLLEEFPAAVYFFWNYKTDFRRPPKYPDHKPIEFFASLDEGIKASKLMPNGPARPEVAMRLPWPEDFASGDPERLIGGRTIPGPGDYTAELRQFGRCIGLIDDNNGYVDARTYRQYPGDRPILTSVGTLPPSAYPLFYMLSGGPACLHAYYDTADPETTAFVTKVKALWRRLYTQSVAIYNPIDDSVVLPKVHYFYIGKHALANAVDGSKRYPCRYSRPGHQGPALMIGPRPKKSRTTKGLPANDNSGDRR
jgi:hypothetical protein